MSDTVGAVLPVENANALTDAYKAYKEACEARSDEGRIENGTVLARLILSGKTAGWPGRAMAKHTGNISAERLWQIMKKYDDGQPVAEGTPAFPVIHRPVVEPKPKTQPTVLTSAEAKKLRQLAKRARANTGSRPLNSPYRKDSEELSALLIAHHQNGVIWADLAKATNYSIVGVRMRAARHGYGKGAPPSIQGYRRVVVQHPKKKPVEDSDSVEQDDKALLDA